MNEMQILLYSTQHRSNDQALFGTEDKKKYAFLYILSPKDFFFILQNK